MQNILFGPLPTHKRLLNTLHDPFAFTFICELCLSFLLSHELHLFFGTELCLSFLLHMSSVRASSSVASSAQASFVFVVRFSELWATFEALCSSPSILVIHFWAASLLQRWELRSSVVCLLCKNQQIVSYFRDSPSKSKHFSDPPSSWFRLEGANCFCDPKPRISFHLPLLLSLLLLLGKATKNIQ